MNQLLAELRRRNVFRVAAAYLVGGWLVLQVTSLIADAAAMPAWADSLVLIMLLAGFPVAIIIAWAFESSPEGIRRTGTAGSAAAIKPVGPTDYVILFALAVVTAMIGWQILNAPSRPDGQTRQTTPLEILPGNERIAEAPAASIAVLPFADLSSEGNQSYFGDGMAEEILNVLTRVDGLLVTSRTSSFAFKNQHDLNIQDIGAELGVRYIVEGSIRTSGNAVRVTAQLIDVSTDQNLWSQTFDRQLAAENLFHIQDQIAGSISSELAPRVGIDFDPAIIDSSTVTTDLNAYEAYLHGHDLFIHRNYEVMPQVIDLLEQAVEIDPRFGRAWAELAMAYSVAPGWALADRDYYRMSEVASARALELDPENSVALTALGAIRTNYASLYNIEEAMAFFDRAIVSDPFNTTAFLWRGDLHALLGDGPRALADFSRCLELIPNYALCTYRKAVQVIEVDGIHAALDVLLPVFSTHHVDAYSEFLGLVAQSGDDYALTLMLREMAKILPGESNWIVPQLRRALSDEEYDRRTALERFEARLLEQGYRSESDEHTTIAYRLAFRAYELVPYTEDWPWWSFRGYPGLVGSQAARRAIVAHGLPEYWQTHGFPPQCRPVGETDFACDRDMTR